MSNKQLPHEEIIQLIWDIEENFDVSNIVFEGVHIWPILRILIYNENLWKNHSNPSTIKQRIKKSINLLNILFERILDKKNNLEVKPSDIYISSHTTSRTTRVNGQWHDFIFSPLVEWMHADNPDVSIFFEEFSPNGLYKIPRYEVSEYFTINLIIERLKANIFPTHKSTNLDKQIKNIKKYIETKGGLSASLNSKSLYHKLGQFINYTRYYEKKLDIVKPRLVCIVTYYSLWGMSLVHTARKKGIETIDMQHGVQGEKHVAYGSWRKVPSKGYSCLPDLFWVWSYNEKKSLQISKEHKAFIGGNIQASYWKNKKNRAVDAILKTSLKLKRDIILLVSLQPGLEYLVDEVVFLIRHPLFFRCYWLIRLHPSMGEEATKNIGDKLAPFSDCCDYNQSSFLPLPLLLNITRGHVTISSSVTIEAAKKGVSTMLYYENNSLFSDLAKKNYILSKKENQTFFELTVEYLDFISTKNIVVSQEVDSCKATHKLLKQSLTF